MRTGFLTDEQLKKIKSVDKVRKEQRKQTVEGDPEAYSTLLLGSKDTPGVLEKAGKRTDIIQYVLVLAGDLINGTGADLSHPTHNFWQATLTLPDAPSFAQSLASRPEPYKPFLALLNQSSNPEDPIPLLASSFLSNLVASALTSSSKPLSRDDEALPKIYSYLSKLTKNQDSGLQDIGVQQYSLLLRSSRAKQLFWQQRSETVEPLMDILRSATGAAKETDSTLWSGATSIRSSDTSLAGGVSLQLLYHVLLVIWQLSFEAKLVGRGLQKYVSIAKLVHDTDVE